MEDWEDEPVQDAFKIKEPLKSNWDDEDLDDVKESWEDDDDDSATVPNTEPPLPKMASKKAAAKSVEKKVDTIEAIEEAPLDPVQES